MEAEKRVLRSRNPLSDCTNIDSLTPAPSPSSSSSVFKKFKSATTTPSSNRNCVVYSRRHTSDKRNCSIASNPSSHPSSMDSTHTQSLNASSVAGTSGRDVSQPNSVVYSRRHTSEKRKNKEKAVAIPFGGSTMVKIFSNGEDDDEVEVVNRPEGSTFPCGKKQRAMSSEDISNHGLLEDFINKQKAYFDEIDGYKLPVEEVDSDEELE